MPEDMKAKEWKRFVDDCFIVYEHGDNNFDEFFSLLNTLDEHIRFTYEKSESGTDLGLPSEVIEALPFLDFMVMRCLDTQSNTLCNKISIYRKACHSGSYVHAFSSQPNSVKRSVIRSLFLRAFRYCDSQFLGNEENKIHNDFKRLGYNQKFIARRKLSDKQGRECEIRISQ